MNTSAGDPSGDIKKKFIGGVAAMSAPPGAGPAAEVRDVNPGGVPDRAVPHTRH